MTSYNKEVTAVIAAGVPAEDVILLYQELTERFERVAGRPELTDFRRNLLDQRKHHRGLFHYEIDDVCRSLPWLPVRLTWREVKYEPLRIRRCAVCSSYFYDASRNGRTLTCYTNYCRTEYERRKRRPGTIIDPVYYRSVEEIPVDFSPAEDDAYGHALLNKVEMTAWRDRSAKT